MGFSFPLGNSIQKLSADQSRASNAIRDWGHTEGEDLGVSALLSMLLQPRYSRLT